LILPAALGKPVIEISCHPADGDPLHFESPERFGTVAPRRVLLAPRHSVAPCQSTRLAREPHCIMQVSVDPVLHAARSLLAPTAQLELQSRTAHL
jgi:heptosyltransferase-2